MSNAPKNVTPAEIKAMADEKKAERTVPTQSKAPEPKVAAVLADVQETAVDELQDALRMVESKMKHVYGVGVDVRITRDDEGEFTVEVVDPNASKLQRLKNGAAGVFSRNKKLILASVGLLAASVVLKAVNARQGNDEADETDGEPTDA